jgi:cytochrome P450
MSSVANAARYPGIRGRKATRVPLHYAVRGLVRDPVGALAEVGRRGGGDILRFDLGPFRPYVISRPEHVQHVLRDRATTFVRQGLLWRPLQRLLGDGFLSDGPTWEMHRRLVQPMFSAKNINGLLDTMSDAIADAVDELDRYARSGEPVDACAALTRVVHRAVIRVFFGSKLSTEEADRLGPAIETAFTSLGYRLLLPFVPEAVRLPGDRAFLGAVRTVDDVIYPVVRRSRGLPADGYDVVSLLLQARDENGNGLSDERIRDDLVTIFVAGSETTAVALTWLWLVLHHHPDVAARLYAEVDQVVGADQPGRRHLPGLRYTRMVLQEILRMYPVGWIVPRIAAADDVIDGVRISAGSTVVVSPYLTHRIERIWPRPERFDPERFGPDAPDRHSFAYIPFGGGPHVCLGSHFFTVEAQLIVACLLSRYRPTLASSPGVRPRPAASLRPAKRVDITLRPVDAR